MQSIYAVSDATGTTAERVVRAALIQFDNPQIKITRYGGVRTASEIRDIVALVAQAGGFIVHTFVYEDLRHAMLTEGRAFNVATIDLMGPLLARLTEILATPPRSEPGLFKPFDTAYLQRVEAIDYTVRHDDGQNCFDLDKAEIVLVGVSRTSKTPLSIYLAYRGWKVANIPLVLGVEPPIELFNLPKNRVVGLIVKPERLVDLRRARVKHLGTRSFGYADLNHIRQEVSYAYHIFERRKDWPLVDVTAKPIEEAASEVVTLISKSDLTQDEKDSFISN